MQKKRVTRSSQKDEISSLMEFEFQPNNNLAAISNQPKTKMSQNKKQIKSRSNTQQIFPNHSDIQEDKDKQLYQSNPISIKALNNIKKKKINKKQENQGIIILKQKQSQRIFQHLCNPDGAITVQSLGRVMVRAKKQFQLQDLQNMIAYYDTIKKMMEIKDGGDEQKVEIKTKQKKEKNSILENKKIQLISQVENINENSQSNFEDDLDQSEKQVDSQIENQQQGWKTSLNFQQFKLIKQYFDK